MGNIHPNIKKKILFFGTRKNNTGGINKWCSQLVDESKYEFIYCHEETVNGPFQTLGTLYNIFIKSPIKSIALKSDVIIYHKEIYALTYLFSSLFRSSVFLVIHGFHHDNEKYNYFLRTWTSKICYYVIQLRPSNVILVSKYDQLQLEPKLQARIKLVENAIEYPVKRRNEMNCNNKVVYMGRISCEKGILDFVRKNQLTGFELNIYGPLELSFEDEQDFLSIIDNNENFIFHGNVSFSEVRNILSQYEFFLNPSRRESLPYSVLEAVSCDCKLILSDIKAHHALGFDALYFDQQLDEAEIIEKVWDLQGNINRLMENHNIEKWKESLNQII